MIVFDGNRKLYKANLHLHTTLSDGRKTPEEARAIYKENGYDFLAITDHRKVTTQTMTDGDLISIQSIEFDFFLIGQVIHIVGIGVDDSITEVLPKLTSPQRAITGIHAAGGLAILAHPAWSLNTPEVINGLRGLDAVEIYNTVSGMPFNRDRADSSSVLDAAFSQGNLLNLVASDDAHFYVGDECKSYIMAACKEKTVEALKEAVRAGDFYATQGPEFKKIEFDGSTLKVWTSPVKFISFPTDLPWGGPTATQTGDGLTYAEYTINTNFPLPHKFIRVMLVDENGKRAWSNPIDLTK